VRMEGKRILITGATGFLGGRLAEHMFLSNRQIHVRGLVHNSYNMSRLARLPVEMVFGDITSIEEMRNAIQGCDVVVHCAYGSPYETVKGTECVIRAALESGVSKFIHISSVAVYGYSPSAENIKNEKCDYNHTNDDYCDSKIASEKIAFYFYESKNLPLVVLRPANIFGPYSKPWTLAPINMLKRKCYVLVNGGFSPSNVVYVDNVVDAIELAIEQEDAIGHVVNISSDEAISWQVFFTCYASMFDHPPSVLNISSEDIRSERTKYYNALLKRMLFHPRQIPAILPLISSENKLSLALISIGAKRKFKSRIIALNACLPGKTKINFTLGRTDTRIQTLDCVPNRNLERIFTMPYQFPIRKAARILGYEPRFSFKAGMKLTKEWLNYNRLLEN
jgi:nucleoside-diphosphate-sugar epimerase